jgi:hypothetical protein
LERHYLTISTITVPNSCLEFRCGSPNPCIKSTLKLFTYIFTQA